MKVQYNVVIPVHKTDWPLLKKNIKYILKYLNPKSIIVISSNEIEHELLRMDNVVFLDENKCIPGLNYQAVVALIKQRTGGYRDCKRAGWYFQQFIKMGYAYCCEEPCYLLWDADAIPLRKIKFIEKRQYIIDLKDEYHKPYFLTINKLLGLDKIKDESFIAEHMIIDKNIMLELLDTIEKNESLDGTSYFEKIMNAISRKDIGGSGFSEYETYGSYAVNFHKELFQFRRLDSLRAGKLLFGDIPDKESLKWAAKSYDIICFEKNHKRGKIASIICSNPITRCFKLRWIWKLYKKVIPGVYYD